MSLRLVYQVVSGDYYKQLEATRLRIATAATGAMKDAAESIKTKARSSIASGGLSTRWQNALRVKVFPQHGVSISPAALVYHKIPYADVFEDGRQILGNPMLWLPLESAPFGRGGKRITPQQFVDTIGPLYTMRVPGKRPMLSAVVRETDARANKPASLALLKRGRNPGGRGTVRLVPVYIGVVNISDPKKFDITAVVQEEAGELGDLYIKNWGAGNGG